MSILCKLRWSIRYFLADINLMMSSCITNLAYTYRPNSHGCQAVTGNELNPPPPKKKKKKKKKKNIVLSLIEGKKAASGK